MTDDISLNTDTEENIVLTNPDHADEKVRKDGKMRAKMGKDGKRWGKVGKCGKRLEKNGKCGKI